MWIARDKDGYLYLYYKKPIKGKTVFEEVDGSYKNLPKELYPEVTWENSPKQLVIKEE